MSETLAIAPEGKFPVRRGDGDSADASFLEPVEDLACRRGPASAPLTDAVSGR